MVKNYGTQVTKSLWVTYKVISGTNAYLVSSRLYEDNRTPLFADLCKIEYEIDYAGNDDTMPDGKLKCSSTIQANCTQQSYIHTAQGCRSFCKSSKYFTWTSDYKECYCKNSNSVRTHWDGGVSGNTNCHGKSARHAFSSYLSTK